LISVIIPTCYRNDFLTDCLQRLAPEVQAANGFEFEVIVTDDSKNQQAKQLVEQNFPWAKWLKGPSKGPAANRNNGAQHASGEWFIFLDDDCLPDNALLNNYYCTIRNNPTSDVIEGSIYSDKQIKLLYIAPVNLTGGHLWSCNFAIKATVFKQIGGFDENYRFPNLEDNDLYKRLIAQESKIVFAKEAKVYHAPRQVASPKKLAQRHESWLYYHAKFGEAQTLTSLIKTIVRARLIAISHAPKSLTTVKAFAFIFPEVYYTLKFSRKWKKANQ